MTFGLTLQRDVRGAAAAEMALVLPLLLALLFGAVELGRYFWSEHVLLKGVRDGAVFAARQRIDNFDCAAASVDAEIISQTRTLVQTGKLSGGNDLLPNWSSASFAIELNCVTSSGGTALGGIYSANGGNVPVLTVSASVPFTSLFGLRSGLHLNASQQAAVYGA